MKRIRSLWLGILLGITAVVAMGIVYIDNVKHYLYQAGGLVQLVVNTNVMVTVSTNTLRLGINITNTSRSVIIQGRPPDLRETGNGLNGGTVASVLVQGGAGGSTTTNGPSNNGGTGGGAFLTGGIGGTATNVTGDTIFGSGGPAQLSGGAGGSSNAAQATNSQTYGTGGNVTLTAAPGGANTGGVAPTNAVGGNGGAVTASAGAGSTPSVGWIRKPGAGGSVSFIAGSSGANAIRTNGSAGGSVSFAAGAGGGVFTATGDAGPAGTVNFTGGGGANGAGGTNSNGGSVYSIGGAGGTGALPGDVVLARDESGNSRGGVMIGPNIGGAVAVTNMLGGTAALDFGSVAAGAFEDLPIAVTGVTSNNVAVSLSVPWQSAQTGGAFVAFNSNDVIFVRFINNSLVAAIDPAPGDFVAVGFRIR